MRILVFGAGVLGSLCAARLHDAGHDVTILARGDRLTSIRERGIVVRDEAAGLTSTSLVPVIDSLDPADRYDVAFVFVRREQRQAILPALAANATPTIVFMGNDATGGRDLREALGSRLVLGFAMAGGTIVDGVVHARVARATSPTMLGEPDGTVTERVRELAVVLASAGFRTEVTPAIGAWLATHAAVVVPVAAAIYGASGDVRRLAATPDLLLLTIRGAREALGILRSAGIPVTPRVYARLFGLPEGLLSTVLARALATDAADLMLAGHARHSRAEMAALDADLAALAEGTGVETPSLDRLRAWLDPSIEPMERGSRTLVVTHPGRAAAVAVGSAAAGLAIGMLVLRRARPDLAARLSSSAVLATRLPSSAVLAARLPSSAVLAARLPSSAAVFGRSPRAALQAVHAPTVRGSTASCRPRSISRRSAGPRSTRPSSRCRVSARRPSSRPLPPRSGRSSEGTGHGPGVWPAWPCSSR
jgi:2-dehydropantoate 2-reductase